MQPRSLFLVEAHLWGLCRTREYRTPTFTGGFAGIQSTIPFDVVDVTFNSSVAPAFALDNVRVANSAVPEPTTLLLLVSGMGLFLLRQLCNRRFID
jgi:hypothetical protein